MKALLIAFALAAGLASQAVAGAWGYPGFPIELQGPKGRPGPGHERADPGRDFRQERRAEREDRRERMSEDDRRALHRDLDKANRELYRRRFQK